jgi:hypothetical protein
VSPGDVEPQRPPYYRIVPRRMWTAECVHCGRDLFADGGDYVAFTDKNSVDEVMFEGYYRCKCGAPLSEFEAELLAEGDPPHQWAHRDPEPVRPRRGGLLR